MKTKLLLTLCALALTLCACAAPPAQETAQPTQPPAPQEQEAALPPPKEELPVLKPVSLEELSFLPCLIGVYQNSDQTTLRYSGEPEVVEAFLSTAPPLSDYQPTSPGWLPPESFFPACAVMVVENGVTTQYLLPEQDAGFLALRQVASEERFNWGAAELSSQQHQALWDFFKENNLTPTAALFNGDPSAPEEPAFLQEATGVVLLETSGLHFAEQLYASQDPATVGQLAELFAGTAQRGQPGECLSPYPGCSAWHAVFYNEAEPIGGAAFIGRSTRFCDRPEDCDILFYTTSAAWYTRPAPQDCVPFYAFFEQLFLAATPPA